MTRQISICNGSLLSLDDFAMLLNAIPVHEAIDIGEWNGEPFSNPLCPAMVQLAKQRGYIVHLTTTTMGLSNDGVVTLRNHKPDKCEIHVPDTARLKIPDYDWISAHTRFRSTGIKAKYFTLGMLSRTVAEYLAGVGIFVERR